MNSTITRFFGVNIRLLSVVIISMVIVACGDDSGEPTSVNQAPTVSPPPGPPVASDAARVSWSRPTQKMDGSSLQNLEGFKVYYGANADNLQDFVEINDPSATSYTLEGLSSGRKYFAVVAFDSDMQESPLSGIVSKLIP